MLAARVPTRQINVPAAMELDAASAVAPHSTIRAVV
jgi:hypothetical protein